MSKAKRQTSHFKRRARERFGIYFSKSDIDIIIKKIQNGEAKFIERSSNRVSVFTVWHNEQNLRVVYDKARKTLVTIMYNKKEDML